MSVEAGSVDDEVSPSAAVLFASVEDVVDEEPPESVDVEAETSVVDVLVVSLPVESVAGDALEEEESSFVVVSEAGWVAVESVVELVSLEVSVVFSAG